MVYFDVTNEQKLRLERLSNSCVRYILGVRRDAHITPHRRRLGWLHPDSCRLYFASLLLYKITRMQEPSYLAAFFMKHKPQPTSRGIQPELLPPFITYEVRAKAFQVQGARFWNSLPSSLRHLPSYSYFTRALRQHLFDLDA